MSVKVLSGTFINFCGNLVEVETDISKGIPVFNIVGLPDTSVRESRERVRSAIENSGFKFPLGRITVNLAPADLRKIGSLLDLPIAIGILMASNQVKIPEDIDDFILLGELSLSGEVKGVNGALPIILEGIRLQKSNFIFSNQNIKECKFAKESALYPFTCLKEVVSFFNYRDMLPYTYDTQNSKVKNEYDYLDFSQIVGQNTSKRALVIAAAGYHNIVLYGSTGSGKSMLSKAFPSIMPDLSKDEQIDIAKIYSIAGLSSETDFERPPFRNVHHNITKTALSGGGRKMIYPGEITLAHHGVLYLDELLEFKKEVIEILREPLEEGYININRLNSNIKLDSKFILIGTFNLCPCGKKTLQDSYSTGCTCSTYEIKTYLKRMSKAIKDRIDIYSYVPRIKYEEIENDSSNLSSNEMKEFVIMAREMQFERLKDTKYMYNSEIKGKDIFELCRISIRVQNILKYYFESADPSLRAYGKVIKLSRTIADIKNNKDIKESDILEAIQFRKDFNNEIV